MGYSSFYIPRHSGTQQGHRKAFGKSKEFYKQRTKLNKGILAGSKSTLVEESIAERYENSYLRKVIRFFSLTIMLMFFFLLTYAIGRNTNDLFSLMKVYRKEKKTLKSQKETKELMITYDVLLATGNSYLDSGSLEAAQAEFSSALKIFNYGIEARIGIFKVFDAQCKISNENCKEAAQSRDYLESIGALTN